MVLLEKQPNKDSQARNSRKNECFGGSNLRGCLLFPKPPSVAAQVFSPTLFKKASVAAQVFPRSNFMSKVTGLWVSLSGWREGRLRVRGWSTQDRGGVCLLFSETPLRGCTSFPRHFLKNPPWLDKFFPPSNSMSKMTFPGGPNYNPPPGELNESPGTGGPRLPYGARRHRTNHPGAENGGTYRRFSPPLMNDSSSDTKAMLGSTTRF